ncbi:MAG: NAD-dependent epimerase/dehydratase family protein [Actinobacteria bacterium]|nr:NAD-dependent epimerase/dehydratase family protein [Actinomycetota bacterium]MBW3648967.1 NAD-dependent epimerase/dehydratase family protein [Actinomycetota bacterium]
MRVVVTGGAGFIGANLCRRLAGTGGIDEVVAYDNLSTGSKDNLAGVDGVDLVEADICDPRALDKAFRGASTVVHLAARPSVPKSIADPVASHVANVTGTLEVLEAVRRAGRPHVIAASSSSVYGANPTLPKHEALKPSPLSPYAAMKLATETYALAWGHSYALDVLAFRFFNVFGPLQPADHAYAAVVPAFVSAALEGRPLPVHGSGEQTRDFTYVGSVAAVVTEAVLRRVSASEPVNLAFGSRTSLLELIAVLEEVLGRPLERQHGDARPGDVCDSQAEVSRLHALFPGVEPVPLVEGVRATVDWFLDQQG